MTGALILVVEDNARNRKLVRLVLCDEGYEVIEATTAETGIELADRHQPDLVLMDIQLPGMDGIEALGILKSSDRTVGVPGVAVTAFALGDDHERALAAGFDGYLEKPISLRLLRAEVHAVVGSAGGRNGGA